MWTLRHGSVDAGTRPLGVIFSNCALTADPDVTDALGTVVAGPHPDRVSRCHMGAHVRPEGWHNWSRPDVEETVRYVEYDSRRPGSERTDRVPWSTELTAAEAKDYAPENVLSRRDDRSGGTVQTRASHPTALRRSRRYCSFANVSSV